MERSGEMILNCAESGIGQPEANPHTQLTPQQDIARSDEEEASRYRCSHDTPVKDELVIKTYSHTQVMLIH